MTFRGTRRALQSSFGGKPARRDVNPLIVNKRVRSIELSTSDTTKLGVRNRSSFGANSETIAGAGTGKARWSVKLTRLRWRYGAGASCSSSSSPWQS